MEIEAIDYANQALSRICQQYRNKPKYTALVQALASIVQEKIDEPIGELLTVYDIDQAEGYNLDVIGEIVGQTRELIDYDLFTFFGYEGAPNAGPYGDSNNPNVGARYFDSGEDAGGDKTLSDAEYKTFIKARILKNYSASTPEDIIAAVKIVLNVDNVHLTEGGMNIDIDVLGDLTDNQLALLQNYDILPRPTGVSIGTVGTYKVLKDSTVTVPSDSDLDIVNNDFEISTSVFGDYNKFGVMYSRGFAIYYDKGKVAALIPFASFVNLFVLCDEPLKAGEVNRVKLFKSDGKIQISINDGESYATEGVFDLSGAGYSGTNGKYIHYADTVDMKLHYLNDRPIYRTTPTNYRAEFDGARWVVKYVVAGYDDILIYSNPSQSHTLPLTGWVSVDSAYDPVPTVTAVAEDFNDGRITDDLQLCGGSTNHAGVMFNTKLVIDDTLIGYWPMMDASGTVAADTSGNGHDGTITDPNWVSALT